MVPLSLPLAAASSCGSTLSQPAGIAAPVMMRTHWPCSTFPAKARPA